MEFPAGSATTAGGLLDSHLVPGILWLQDAESKRLIEHRLLLEIPERDTDSAMPSLLGRDITDRYRLVVDPANDVLTLDDPGNYR